MGFPVCTFNNMVIKQNSSSPKLAHDVFFVAHLSHQVKNVYSLCIVEDLFCNVHALCDLAMVCWCLSNSCHINLSLIMSLYDSAFCALTGQNASSFLVFMSLTRGDSSSTMLSRAWSTNELTKGLEHILVDGKTELLFISCRSGVLVIIDDIYISFWFSLQHQSLYRIEAP